MTLKHITLFSVGLTSVAAAAAIALAQDPGGGRQTSKADDANETVTRMFAFDADKDGKLTRDEVTDARLLRLFDRADADKSGTVTKAELTTLAEKEHAEGGLGGGPGGPGGPKGFGRPGGFGGPPPMRPGEVLPAMFRQALRLNDEQKSQLDTLQAEVNARLEKIVTDAQRAQLKDMSNRGPGGFGGPTGPGGFGGPPPGGPPPRGEPR